MLIASSLARLALWSVTAALIALAYMTSVGAASVDSRVHWAFPQCLAAWAAGLALVAWRRRASPESWAALDLDRHGLALAVAMLAVLGLSHVEPQLTVRVLREEIPPLLGWLPLVIAGLTPVALSRSAGRLDASNQALLVAVAAGTLSGALFLLQGFAALSLAGVALCFALADPRARCRFGALGITAGLVVALLFLATLLGQDRLASRPAMTWVGAAAGIAAAASVRPRDRHAWGLILGAGVAVATIVAFADLALTLDLARRLTGPGALATRLVLFRQHPNFLAPFYAFQLLVAIGLAATMTRRRPALLVVAALLLWATWHTDSRTGQAALLVGLAAVPALWILRAITARPAGARFVAIASALVLVLVLVGGALAVRGHVPIPEGLGRLARSWQYRVDAWSNSAKIIAAHPWSGIGPGTFITVERFAPGSRFFNEPLAPHPHNMFLAVAQAAGLPALAAMVAWLALLGAGLWRAARQTDASGVLPPTLAIPLLAGVISLVVANLADLSMSLDTVVPWPIFILTGMVGTRRDVAGMPMRGTRALLAAGVFAVIWFAGVRPIIAEMEIERAELLAFESSRTPDRAATMTEARAALRHAIALDPTRPRAHEHLARWLEATEGGFEPARQVLLDQIALAEFNGRGHGQLARLYMRAGAWSAAADAFGRAMADPQGGEDPNGDRALRISALARAGRGLEAQSLLAEFIRLDVGVIDRIGWSVGERGMPILPVTGSPSEPVRLLDAVEQVWARHLTDARAGRPVGRRFWMDTFRALQATARLAAKREDLDTRATELLDYMWDDVPEVERHSIENERALIAERSGDLAAAIAHFENAYELTDKIYFHNKATEIRRRESAPPDGTSPAADAETLDPEMGASEDGSLPSVGELGDFMTYTEAYVHVFEARAEILLAQGRPREAAENLEPLLLFTDDLLERARLHLRIGSRYLDGGDPQRALDALRAAFAEVSAKPFPYETLRTDHTDSLPQQLARTCRAAWLASGVDDAAAMQRAWRLPGFHSPREGPSLFRIGLFIANGRVDALLTEADLLLLARPDHALALWARLFALEALGRHGELSLAMRAVIETFNEASSAARLFDQLADLMRNEPQRQERADAWRQLAMADLLRGRFAQAADWFGRGADLAEDDRQRAALVGWQARAVSQSGTPDAWPRTKELLLRATALDPDDRLLRLRLETLP